MQCMRNRAHQICKDTSKQEELQLEEVFIANGYPVRTVNKTFSSTARKTGRKTEEDPAKPMFLPYVRGLSEKLEKVCALLGVNTIFRPRKTLRSMLMQVKQKTPKEIEEECWL